MDEEFQILLGAKFDEKEIQSQLNKLTNFSINVGTIKVNRQAINDLEKNNRISLKLEVDNTVNVQKQIQQAAQNAQKSFGNVTVKDFLDNQTKKLMDSYGVSGEAAFKRIRKAVDDCFADIQKFGNTTHKIFDDALGIERTVSLFDGVSESLRDNIKIANEAQGVLAQFYNYVKATNNSGHKIHIPDFVRQGFGEEWKSARATMGAAFTTQQGNYEDLENYFSGINDFLGKNFIDLSQGVDVAAKQFVSMLTEARHGLKILSGNDLPDEWKQASNMLAESMANELLAFSQNLSQIENSETRSADIVVESEKRKQQAMAETANVAKQTSQTVVDSSKYNDSVAVSKRKNKDISNLAYSQHNSDGTYNQDAANQAHAKIKELLEDEEALIATTQRLDSTGNLQSFSTNIKHANGLVETLNFSLKEVEDTNEKIFMFNGATLNDSGAIKLFEQRQKALEQYQNKYREFLSKNSGAELNTTDIDKAFDSFKQGSISIDELKSSWSSFKVSLQQFRADWEKIMDIPSDCADGMYITDEIYENIKLPTRATKGSAGYDFYSPTDFTLMPNQSITFPTGICVEIEPNWVLKIYPRSSLGIKNDTGLKNHVGIVDSDYAQSDNEGHIFCSLKNNGLRPLHVKAGDRLMQGVFVPYGITYDDNCEETRNGGIGSTNV